MKITEKMLLDNYVGFTNGMDFVSKIEGEKVVWNYRCLVDGEPESVCEIEDREVITLEYDREGVVNIDNNNDNHPTFGQMKSDEAKIVGAEI